jgi:bacteriocin-like protein
MRELTIDEMEQVSGGECGGLMWYIFTGQICCGNGSGYPVCYQF